MLVQGITNNLQPAFDAFAARLDNSTALLQQTPQTYNAGMFNMVMGLAQNVMMPIAVVILTAILTYDLIYTLENKNSMDEFDFYHIQLWLVKVVVALLFLGNSIQIINVIFTLGVVAVTGAAELLNAEIAANPIDDVIYYITYHTTNEDLGALAGLFLMSWLVRLIMLVVELVIHWAILSRFFIIYIKMTAAPIPLATMINHEWRHVGNNYLKTIMAVSFQGFFMIAIIALYYVALLTATNIEGGIDMSNIWNALGLPILYSIIVVTLLLKTESISKSIFGAM